jgi:hypothetical protein
MIVFVEASLYRHVQRFLDYPHVSGTHLTLAKDAPESRSVQGQEVASIVAIAQHSGLYHNYELRTVRGLAGTAALLEPFRFRPIAVAITATRSMSAKRHSRCPKPQQVKSNNARCNPGKGPQSAPPVTHQPAAVSPAEDGGVGDEVVLLAAGNVPVVLFTDRLKFGAVVGGEHVFRQLEKPVADRAAGVGVDGPHLGAGGPLVRSQNAIAF